MAGRAVTIVFAPDALTRYALLCPSYTLPSPLVTVSADWLGGEPCFTARRVPVKALFDYLKSGQTVEQFIDDYPSVSHEQAVALIGHRKTRSARR